MGKEQQEREAFENWHDGIFDVSARTAIKNDYGYPQNGSIQARWQVWQARTPEIEALRAEVLALQERLEITHCHDGDGSRVEIPDSERKDFPDGIYCRDETIRLLEESNEALRAKLREYEGRPAVEGKPWEIQTRDELLNLVHQLTSEANAGRQAEREANEEMQEQCRIIGASGERELELIARIEQLEKALKRLACLGNGSEYGNSEGNLIAQQALAQADASKAEEV